MARSFGTGATNGPSLGSLTITKVARPCGEIGADSNWERPAADGKAFGNEFSNDCNSRSGPSISTSTPRNEFRTEPPRPSSVARRKIAAEDKAARRID
jgi:hypothetical protein